MRTEVLGVGFDPVTLDGAVEFALEAAKLRGGAYVCTPNPEIVMLARKDEALRRALENAALVLPDGAGVVWAAGLLGRPVPERVAGYDFLLALLDRLDRRDRCDRCDRCDQPEGGVFILGGRPGVAERAARAVKARFPRVPVAGCRNGYDFDEAELAEAISRARPALLMVCLGSPRQELWMAAHTDLPVGLMAGLGGSLDVLAGDVRRAPRWWRAHGLEWLYRLLRQPWRFRRQLRLPRFVAAVLRQRARQKKRGSCEPQGE